MNYDFPLITHIDQVLPAIEGSPEFNVHDKGDYTVIDYAVAFEDTFPPVVDYNSAVRRECRGIMFDMTGNLISRPYHKFFNLNEKEETQEKNIKTMFEYINGDYWYLDKMDGSFVRPVKIGDKIRLCTKAGITEQSMMAEEFIKDKYHYWNFFKLMVDTGYTPLFEFCSRQNQIVIDYPEPFLMLIAIRENLTGKYLHIQQQNGYAGEFGIPSVASCGSHIGGPIEEMADHVRKSENCEGIVMRFYSGHMMKVKSEWYCVRHRAKDSLLQEKNLIATFLEGKLDDVIPMLDDSFRARVEDYIYAVKCGIVESVADAYNASAYLNRVMPDCRRDQAEWVKTNVEEHLRPLVFNALDGKDLQKCIFDRILKNTSTSTKLDTVRPLFKAEWK